jgi:hypothetical protein
MAGALFAGGAALRNSFSQTVPMAESPGQIDIEMIAEYNRSREYIAAMTGRSNQGREYGLSVRPDRRW